MVTLEAILDAANMYAAYCKVVANGGSAGADGMQVGDLSAYIMEHYADPMEPLRAGKYKPLPVRRVHIPKEEFLRKEGWPCLADALD